MMNKQNSIGIAFTGCKIVEMKRSNIMLNYIKNMFAKDELVSVKKLKRTETRGRKSLTKTQKVINLFEKGETVTWKVLRNRFDLTSPRAMVDKLRSLGYMIYVNKSAKGTTYRLGTPTRAIIAAGIKKLYGTPYAYGA